MSNNSKYTHISILGALLAAGLICAAFIVGNQIKQNQPAGVISVEGFAETEQKSTLGMWRVGVEAIGDTYAETIEQNKTEIVELTKFLVVQGLLPESFELKALMVNENMEKYIDDLGKERSRKNGFKAVRYIDISTSELDKIKKAFANIQELKAKNQAIIFDSPNYYVENIETLKRTLIAKATQDAHARAEEFAKTSNVKVGALKSATQGAFEIRSVKPTTDHQTEDTSSIDKKVRLAVSVQYEIEK